MRQSYKTALLWVFLFVMFFALWRVFDSTKAPPQKPNWSEFMKLV